MKESEFEKLINELIEKIEEELDCNIDSICDWWKGSIWDGDKFVSLDWHGFEDKYYGIEMPDDWFDEFEDSAGPHREANWRYDEAEDKYNKLIDDFEARYKGVIVEED